MTFEQLERGNAVSKMLEMYGSSLSHMDVVDSNMAGHQTTYVRVIIDHKVDVNLPVKYFDKVTLAMREALVKVKAELEAELDGI